MQTMLEKKGRDDGIELLSESHIQELRQRHASSPRPSIDKPPQQTLPRSTFFIIGSEFCERFTYYGMKTILALFFVHRLNMSERAATEAMALFAVASYATPLIGAYISDALLGRYKTIVRLSSVYLIGTVLMALSAALSSGLLVLIALILVAFGTGGIKPNVSAFGGDQIDPPEPVALQRFFSFFYAAINAGSLLSSLTTPVVRIFFGYSIAFALPACLMFIALVALVWGRKTYRHVAPQGDLTAASLGVVSLGIGSWWSGKHPLASCLDGAVDRYGVEFVNDVRKLGRVFVLFLPAPLFWSLFDQQSSRWTFQATRMNSVVAGVMVPPEMVQSLNAVLILVLIPLFDRVFYPTVSALCGSKVATHAVHRMAAGMVLASLSFGLAALVQWNIDANMDDDSFESVHNSTKGDGNDDNDSNSRQISVLWLIPQYVVMTAGEILFSVTGLEFAFKEAPASMKSVVTSGWLLTTAMGNLFTVIFLEILTQNMNQIQEFIAFSFGCMLAMIWLLYLFHCYQRNSWGHAESQLSPSMESQPTRDPTPPPSLSLPFPMSSSSFHQPHSNDTAQDINSGGVMYSPANEDGEEDAFHEPSYADDGEIDDVDDDDFADCDLGLSSHGSSNYHTTSPIVVDIL
mmetsp:Transcript_25143/g.32715  ORF Transcript_25143/g.32715 Transcript_25143/m.32715 type:complete len:632 (+) Transcript_25143:125-2020(+)